MHKTLFLRWMLIIIPWILGSHLSMHHNVSVHTLSSSSGLCYILESESLGFEGKIKDFLQDSFKVRIRDIYTKMARDHASQKYCDQNNKDERYFSK